MKAALCVYALLFSLQSAKAQPGLAPDRDDFAAGEIQILQPIADVLTANKNLGGCKIDINFSRSYFGAEIRSLEGETVVFRVVSEKDSPRSLGPTAIFVRREVECAAFGCNAVTESTIAIEKALDGTVRRITASDAAGHSQKKEWKLERIDCLARNTAHSK